MLREKLYYISIWEQARNSEAGFAAVASYVLADNSASELNVFDASHFEKYLVYKLKSLDGHKKHFYTYFESAEENWHMKRYDDYLYVIVTSRDYDLVVAAECLDDLTNGFLRLQKEGGETGESSDDDPATMCCQVLGQMYATFDEGSKAYSLRPLVSKEYSESARQLQECFRRVDKVKESMDVNIQKELENMEKAEEMIQLADDLMEQSKLFKKKAKKLKWRMQARYYVPVVAAASVGCMVGFLGGGPAGAFALTGMTSVAAAQAIEATAVGAVFAMSYAGLGSTFKTSTFRQGVHFLL